MVLICHVFPPEPNTGGLMTRDLAEDLTRAGHDVTVLTGWPNFPQGTLYQGWRARFRQVDRRAEGYRVIRCGHSIHPRERMSWRLWYYFTFAVSSLLNGLAAGRVDSVMIDSTPLFGTWSGWLLARLKRARAVYWIQDLHPETALDSGMIRPGVAARVLRRADTALCRRCDVVATITESMRQACLRRGLGPAHVVIASTWLDPAKFPLAPRDNPWRRSQGIGPETFLVLHAGTIGFISAPIVMIDAAERLRHRRDILLLFVGGGMMKDHLVAETRRRKLENVRFLPYQPAEAVPEVQAASDVSLVTLSSQSGGSSVPSRMIGYIAAGRPVIASVRQDSAIAATVQEGSFGFITPPEDPDALAKAILYAADHREELVHLGQRARQFFLKAYDRKAWTAVCESLLTGPVSPCAPGPPPPAPGPAPGP
jgi:colanic acid biosynthesis glycosyl transferase WcaI